MMMMLMFVRSYGCQQTWATQLRVFSSQLTAFKKLVENLALLRRFSS